VESPERSSETSSSGADRRAMCFPFAGDRLESAKRTFPDSPEGRVGGERVTAVRAVRGSEMNCSRARERERENDASKTAFGVKVRGGGERGRKVMFTSAGKDPLGPRLGRNGPTRLPYRPLRHSHRPDSEAGERALRIPRRASRTVKRSTVDGRRTRGGKV